MKLFNRKRKEPEVAKTSVDVLENEEDIPGLSKLYFPDEGSENQPSELKTEEALQKHAEMQVRIS
jgi:hypothetical protein